jgi:hypothetical protein
MFIDTTLRPDAQRHARAIGHANLVVGIPTYKNMKTIAKVMQAIAEGLTKYYPDMRSVIVVADGMSTDDTVQVAKETALPGQVHRLVTLYQGLPGKGSAAHAVFEVMRIVDARACALLDGDLRSITPEWIHMLFAPILQGGYDYVTPLYSRHRFEVAINDALAYPLLRTLFGQDVRQPLAGEVALSAALVDELLHRDVWETDVARFGIHVWMSAVAVTEGWKVCQTALDTKTHDYRDPTIGFEPKFLQVVGTLFRLLSIYRRIWPNITEIEPVPVWGEPQFVEPEPIPAAREAIREAIRKGTRRFQRTWGTVLTPDNLAAVQELVTQERPQFPVDLWVKAVYDFAVVYNKGEGDPDKVVMALLPLYYTRKLSWMDETEGMSFKEVDEAVRAQAERFAELRDYLIERWNSYLPWASEDYF